MRRWIAAVAIGFAVLALHAEAQAQCTTHTYVVGGVLKMCTTCCYGLAGCTTTCY